MPEQIISASGPQYGMIVNQDGSINVSGVDITIGSLALALESVYITSGNVAITEEIPIADNKNNAALKFEYTGNKVGSIVQFIDAGSYVQVFGYSGNVVSTIGSWI